MRQSIPVLHKNAEDKDGNPCFLRADVKRFVATLVTGLNCGLIAPERIGAGYVGAYYDASENYIYLGAGEYRNGRGFEVEFYLKDGKWKGLH